MKALVKAKAEKGIWMQEMPKPDYGSLDVLIKVNKTAICGTDIHIYSWDDWAQRTIPVPMITGHEFVGVIEAIGSEVKGFTIGDQVSGEGHITCGHCRNCRGGKRHLCRNTIGVGVNRPGCFADYLVLPASNVIRIPDGIDSRFASILDPLGNAAHSALKFNLVGEDVLITGAGPIGTMAVAIAKHAGARIIVISDLNDYRLSIAEDMGATRVVNIKKINIEQVMKELHIEEGFDVGLEMSGNPTALNNMIRLMNHGGKIALLGIPDKDIQIDLNQIIFKSLQLHGIYGREMFETWYKMLTFLKSGMNLMPVITHQFQADEYQQAFEVMCSGNASKVILDWESA